MTSRDQPSSLPPFVDPMLARPGGPFDSDKHLFEIKWDGTRMLAFVEQNGIRLINRHRAERTVQYPELSCLTELPAGTILDGELVLFADGRPDFGRLLSRDQTCDPFKIQLASRLRPATYVVFDLLYDGYRPLLANPSPNAASGCARSSKSSTHQSWPSPRESLEPAEHCSTKSASSAWKAWSPNG